MNLENERLYFRDIQRYNPLPEEEEQRLVGRIQQNDREALKELIAANLRFVVSVARRYLGRGLTLMELVNEGNLGLFRAAKRFELGKEVKFISYAVWWIRQSIQQALFDQVCMIKIPPNKMAMLMKFKRAMAANNGNFHRTADMPEFRQHKTDIAEVIERVSTISLDTPIKDDGESDGMDTLLDLIGREGEQENDADRRELGSAIDKVLNQMSKREEIILRMYYGINYAREFTLDEIGKELGLTRERVRQIKTKALRKLMRSQRLKEQLYPFAHSGDERRETGAPHS